MSFPHGGVILGGVHWLEGPVDGYSGGVAWEGLDDRFLVVCGLVSKPPGKPKIIWFILFAIRVL